MILKNTCGRLYVTHIPVLEIYKGQRQELIEQCTCMEFISYFFLHIYPSPFFHHLCFGVAPDILSNILKYFVVPMGRLEGTEKKVNKEAPKCKFYIMKTIYRILQ